MNKLQKQYGKDKERYNLEIQKLYEKENVNPMGGYMRGDIMSMDFIEGLFAAWALF